MAKSVRSLQSIACPCGSGEYAQCCEPLHLGALASSPLVLMRSRYSAYVLKLADYLLRSWHPETRPTHIDFDPACKWLGLSVLSHCVNRDQTMGEVHFIARYRIGGASAIRMEERSEFLRWQGRWVYWRAS